MSLLYQAMTDSLNMRVCTAEEWTMPKQKEGETMGLTDRNYGMSEAARKAQNAYKRAWNARNPEKNKEYQRRYWAKKAKEIENTRQKTAGKDVATNGIVNEAD